MAKVHLGAALRDLTDGVAEIDIEADTVRALINQLDSQFPGLGARLREGTSVAINGDIMPDALYEEIPPGAEIHFLPSLSGG